jgi:dissimilatory sulfite reductase (desulfoviridin) alpha/beta subunit
VPNGELTAAQLRYLGDCIAPYGEDGCADITTRANIQLRGVTLEDADRIIAGLLERGLTSFMVGARVLLVPVGGGGVVGGWGCAGWRVGGPGLGGVVSSLWR